MFDLILTIVSLVAGSIGALVLLATAPIAPFMLLIPASRF